jgi:hypothetical protein
MSVAVVRLFLPVADALTPAYAEAIIHPDLEPDNIFSRLAGTVEGKLSRAGNASCSHRHTAICGPFRDTVFAHAEQSRAERRIPSAVVQLA